VEGVEGLLRIVIKTKKEKQKKKKRIKRYIQGLKKGHPPTTSIHDPPPSTFYRLLNIYKNK